MMVVPRTYEEALQLDQGTAVILSSWILIGASAVFVFAKAAARKKLASLESGDVLLPLALILAFIQTICIQFAVDNGLGRTYGILGQLSTQKYHEFMYWAQLLYILILGTTKATIVLLIVPLNPGKYLLTACIIVGTLVVLSTIAFIFATAFQCELPRPWEVNLHKCFNISAFGYALTVMTIVTDVIVLCHTLLAIFVLNLSRNAKTIVCSLLLFRVLVPAFLATQLSYLFRFDQSLNPTIDAATIQIWTQVVLNTSIITACLPSLGCIISDLAVGFTRRRFIPDSIGWGRYSPQGISRLPKIDAEKGRERLFSSDKVPLCSGGLNEKDRPYNNERRENRFSWFNIDHSVKAGASPEILPVEPPPKQVHFLEEETPVPSTPPSNRYPDTEVHSATYDLLSNYEKNWNAAETGYITVPRESVYLAKPGAAYRRFSNTILPKRSLSTSSIATRISEPSFICASTLVTPTSSQGEKHESYPRDSFTRGHRATRSSGSAKSHRSMGHYYGKRDSFLKRHRYSRSLGSVTSIYSNSGGWLDKWSNTIDEEATALGSGSFVNLDLEFERCRRI